MHRSKTLDRQIHLQFLNLAEFHWKKTKLCYFNLAQKSRTIQNIVLRMKYSAFTPTKALRDSSFESASVNTILYSFW